MEMFSKINSRSFPRANGLSRLISTKPADMYAAMGAKDQRIYVIPGKGDIIKLKAIQALQGAYSFEKNVQII